MSLTAGLFAGVPPGGLLAYGRDQSADWLAATFPDGVVLNADRADVGATAARLRALGVPVWVFTGPDRWRPGAWERGAAHLKSVALSVDARGMIANPEAGWPELSAAERDREAAAMGSSLASTSRDVRVGMVSYPLWPALAAFAAASDGRVWGSPEIYGSSTQSPDVMVGYYNRWIEAFGGGRVIPSIACYVPPTVLGDRLRDPAVYDAYLAALPKAGGAICWLPGGNPPAHMLESIKEYDVGSNPVYRGLAMARALASNPFLAIAAVVLILIVGAAAMRMR